MIEIGPGRGALTSRLLHRAGHVIAIELDPGLVEYLRSKFAGEERLDVIHGNVLETSFDQWSAPVIAGNLPYYITSPILEKSVRGPFRRAVFLIQKEVAERLVAVPGTRSYGYLTVATAVYADARLLFEVKASAFHPPPKVDSAVVLLTPRTPALAGPDFLTFVARCFQQKRKTIRNNLAGTYGKERVESWPEASLRAEQIPLEGFLEMYRRL